MVSHLTDMTLFHSLYLHPHNCKSSPPHPTHLQFIDVFRLSCMNDTKTSDRLCLFSSASSPPTSSLCLRVVRRQPPVRRSEGLVSCGERHRDHQRAREEAKPQGALQGHARGETGVHQQVRHLSLVSTPRGFLFSFLHRIICKDCDDTAFRRKVSLFFFS